METISVLINNPGTILGWLCVAVTIASGLTALTPTPPPDSRWAGIYSWVERLALVVAYAKDRGLVTPTARQARVVDEAVALEKTVVATTTVVPRPPVAMLAALGLGLALSACTGGAQNEGLKVSAVAGAATPVLLSSSDVAALQAICAANQPALAAATSPAMPGPIRDTAVYPAAYCAQLASGAVPPTTDANTPRWLPQALAALQIAGEVAKIVLPIVLPLL